MSINNIYMWNEHIVFIIRGWLEKPLSLVIIRNSVHKILEVCVGLFSKKAE